MLPRLFLMMASILLAGCAGVADLDPANTETQDGPETPASTGAPSRYADGYHNETWTGAIGYSAGVRPKPLGGLPLGVGFGCPRCELLVDFTDVRTYTFAVNVTWQAESELTERLHVFAALSRNGSIVSAIGVNGTSPLSLSGELPEAEGHSVLIGIYEACQEETLCPTVSQNQSFSAEAKIVAIR